MIQRLIGGVIQDRNHLIWHGELSNNGQKMVWNTTNIEVPLAEKRTCLKLKSNIYIFTLTPSMDVYPTNYPYHLFRYKLACNRYDMKDRQYHRNEFIIPLTLNNPSCIKYELKSITNADETLAIILLRDWSQNIRLQTYHTYLGFSVAPYIKERIWVFTEINGFKEMPTLETTYQTCSCIPPVHEKLIRIK